MAFDCEVRVRARPRTPRRLTGDSDASSGLRLSPPQSAMAGDGAGHAGRCIVLGLSGVRRYRRGGRRGGDFRLRHGRRGGERPGGGRGMSGLRLFLEPGARLLSAQAEGPPARWAKRRDPPDGPAFHLRCGGLPAPYVRRVVRAAGRSARTFHHAVQPGPGAHRARARRTGRCPTRASTGPVRRPDDLAAQGHGIAGSAARHAVRAGRGRLRPSVRTVVRHCDHGR